MKNVIMLWVVPSTPVRCGMGKGFQALLGLALQTCWEQFDHLQCCNQLLWKGQEMGRCIATWIPVVVPWSIHVHLMFRDPFKHLFELMWDRNVAETKVPKHMIEHEKMPLRWNKIHLIHANYNSYWVVFSVVWAHGHAIMCLETAARSWCSQGTFWSIFIDLTFGWSVMLLRKQTLMILHKCVIIS